MSGVGCLQPKDLALHLVGRHPIENAEQPAGGLTEMQLVGDDDTGVAPALLQPVEMDSYIVGGVEREQDPAFTDGKG